MQNHPSENDVELFVQTPDILNSTSRAQIEGHVSSCPSCQAIVTLLQSFYAEWKELSRPQVKTEQFLDHLLARPRVVQLHAYRYSPDPAQFRQHVMTVLAAKSEGDNNYRYSAVCTLVSQDEETVVRILKDDEMDNYKVFLITKQGVHAPNATVRFPALGLSVMLDPESLQAVFSLPSAQSTVDWSNIVAELRIA